MEHCPSGGGTDAAASAACAGSVEAAAERDITMRAVQVALDGRRLGRLVQLLAHGLLTVSVDDSFPLERAGAARARSRPVPTALPPCCGPAAPGEDHVSAVEHLRDPRPRRAARRNSGRRHPIPGSRSRRRFRPQRPDEEQDIVSDTPTCQTARDGRPRSGARLVRPDDGLPRGHHGPIRAERLGGPRPDRRHGHRRFHRPARVPDQDCGSPRAGRCR
jgi:hypothetical protein